MVRSRGRDQACYIHNVLWWMGVGSVRVRVFPDTPQGDTHGSPPPETGGLQCPDCFHEGGDTSGIVRGVGPGVPGIQVCSDIPNQVGKGSWSYSNCGGVAPRFARVRCSDTSGCSL